MTALVNAFRPSALAEIATRIVHELAMLRDSFTAALAARDAYNHYNSMNDAELARRGLTREEIPALVVAPLLSRD